jgi:predicted RNA-binding Zn ribbon-like protein
MEKNLICLDLVNTMWFDYRGTGKSEDRLDNPEWMKRYIVEWEIEDLLSPTSGIIDELKELRSLLRLIIEKINKGEEPIQYDIDHINNFMAKSSRCHRLSKGTTGYTMNYVSTQKNWDWFISEIALSFSYLMINEDYKRVKICDNQDCRWVFYDETRNRKKAWCDSKCCGTLQRVRRYRARINSKSKDE